MTVIELHPEELLDRARRGTLAPEEQGQLDDHLARCAACRFERQLAHDFEAEAARGGDSGLSALVSGALVAAARTPTSAPETLPAKKRGRHAGLLIAATLLLGSGLAAAQTGLIEQVLSFARPRAAEQRDAESQAPAHVRRARRTVEPGEAPPRLPATPAVPTPPGEPVPTSMPALETPRTRPSAPVLPARRARAHAAAPRASEASPREALPTSATVRPAPGPVASARAVDATPTPAPDSAPAPVAIAPAPEAAPDLFERANELRRQGRSREASSAYRDLMARFPRSPEARLALVLMARLELDHGDPQAALRGFDEYLATRDAALREQALSGRALALGRLDREEAACAAFRALVSDYPSSTYASVAKRRCETD